MLKKLGIVDPKDATEVLKSLSKNKIKGWGKLLDVKTEEDMQRFAGDEIIGTRIWNAIHKNKRAASGAEPESKRLRLVPESERFTASGFVNDSFLVRSNIDFTNPNEVDFKFPLWGDEKNQTFLLKRQGTASVATSIVDEFLLSRPTIILAGSKGTGKSWQGIFIIKELIDRAKIVICEQGNEKMLIVEQKAFGLFNEALTEVFVSFGEGPLLKPGVYAFRPGSEDLFFVLSKHPSFVHIVDIGDNYTGAIDIAHSQIIISSPNSDKLVRNGQVEQPRVIYLDLWTREEMEALNIKLPSQADKKHRLACKSPEDLNELMMMFGRIPREVFKNRTVKEAIDDIHTDIKSVSLEQWKSVLSQSDYSKIPKLVPGILVKITKDERFENRCKVRFASKYVARLVVKQFYRSKRNDLFALAHAVKGEKRLTSQLRGEMLQQHMHEVLMKHPCKWTIAPLLADGIGETREFRVPQLVLKEFESSKMLDLKSLAENDFCVAIATNMPSVESFVITKRRSIGIDEDGLCIVGLQATISPTHPVKRQGLMDIVEHCCQLLGLSSDQLPIYVIFVTTKNGIQRRQKLGKRTERWDAQVLQFVCTDVDFNEILKLYPQSDDEESDSE